MGKMAEWREAREKQRVLAAKKAIASCLEMIKEIPEQNAPESVFCEECTEYKVSKEFVHTLECIKCGNMIEHPTKARLEIYGEQHIIQPADSAPVERQSGSGTDRGTDQSGQSDQRPSEKRDYYAQFDAEAESAQR